MSSAASQKYAREWEKNARLDPLYAILASPHGRDGQWDLGQFFATGADEIDRIFSHLADIGALPSHNERFLDFGCGVGRVCQALSSRFAWGLGIDISATMIRLAKDYCEKSPTVEYIHNIEDDLRVVSTASISFLYSHIVLQHVSNDLQRRFISEFARVLEPGGVGAFQIPVENLNPTPPPCKEAWIKRQIPQSIRDGAKKLLGMPTEADIVTMEMNTLPSEEIIHLIRSGGCFLIQFSYTNSTEKRHSGRLEFFDRAEALARVADGRAHSKFLSGFYFMRKHT
jgi:SAM-dependent methyltransferase